MLIDILIILPVLIINNLKYLKTLKKLQEDSLDLSNH